MGNGYNSKILRVDLSKGTTSVDEIDETFCRRHLGGAGFVAYYLMKELKPKIDPLSPENKLMFMGGPCTGLPLSGSGRNEVGTKSPLTGGVAKSEVGGFWGAELMHAGYDGIIIEGKSPKPVYLFIHDGEVSIRDAAHLWGKPTKETQETIRQELGDNRIRIASIGPAGENLARIACIINDLTEAAGRGGTGAVMGSKNLKAIAIRGTRGPELANPDGLKEFRQWLTDNPKRYATFSEYGTGAAMEAYVTIGNTPIRNFRDGEFDTSGISAIAVKDKIRIAMEGCYACRVRCKKIVKVDEPSIKVDPAYGGPEYETLAAFGNNCGVDDLKVIAKGHELCGAYSLDTISTGMTISFAMECYENGLLTNKDTGGIDLRFGNSEAMLKAIELIAKREGIGDLLAEGAKRAAESIGQGADKFAMHVKGLEVPMHDPRCKAALGLGYEVNPHGADHVANFMDTNYTKPGAALDALHPLGILEPLPAEDLSPKKVDLFHYYHNYRLLADHMVVCCFVPYSLEQYVGIVKAATGWDTGTVELLRIADRTLTLDRMYNLRENFTTADDKLPDRFFQGRVGGPAASKRADREKLEKAKDYYYRLMGWDASGVPTAETLAALDIGWTSGV